MAGLDIVASTPAPESVDIEFHGVLYAITVTVDREDVLTVEIEDKDSLDRWRGEFAAKYVEDITSKTGNFKKFTVFVRMLQTATLQQSDSVFMDLLTFQDLELLKSKKAGAANGQSVPPRQLPASNKRYLILTYASEFDRVHYPLPLLPEEQPDPQRLKGVIRQLRRQLGEAQAAQQHQHQQQIPPQRPSRSSHSQVDDHDHALLSSRIDVLTVQLERERSDHRRELRRKAQQLLELQGELSRSRDVIRDLRMRIKTLEQQQEAAIGHRSTAAGQDPVRRSGDRLSRGSYGSGYLSGSGKYPSNASKYPSRPSRTTSNVSASLRGSSPASSRAQSPSYQRPWAAGSTPPRPPRPSSAPSKQRFDPTEYVRQKRAREQTTVQRTGGSRGSSPVRSSSRERDRINYSNASSPRASASGVLTPRGLQSPIGSSSGVRRPGSSGSLDRQRRSTNSSSGGGYLRPTLSSSRSGSTDRQRPQQQQQSGRSSSRERLGVVYGVDEGNRSSRSSSRHRDRLDQRPSGREGPGSASPGKALQAVKDKLSAFKAHQQQGHQQQQGAAPPAQRQQQQQEAVATAGSASVSAATANGVISPAAADGGSEGGNKVFESASSDLADIDQRLSALQTFLKKAKATVAAS